MSGETESEVSAWTIDSLRYHLEQIATDLDKRYQQRFEAQEIAVQDALAARDKEVESALKAHDRYVELVRQAIDEKIEDRARTSRERLTALEKAYDSRFAAQERNIITASAAQEKRFEGVNEFRSQLRDQQASFLSRDEYIAAHVALIDKVDSGFLRTNERLNGLENRMNLMSGEATGSQTAKAGQRLDTGQLIAVVSVVLAGIAIAVTLILALNS